MLFDGDEIERDLTPVRQTMSIAAAADRLGVPPPCLRAWVDEGHLAVVTMWSRLERGKRVTEEALAQFQAEFIFGNEIGKQMSTQGCRAAEWLRAPGLEPLPSKAATKLYRRAEVTPAILEDLRERQRPLSRRELMEDAYGLARRVGEVVGAELGLTLKREFNCFMDGRTRTCVPVIVGRRQRHRARHIFRFSSLMRRRLDTAFTAWVAFALAGYDTYILLPWQEVRPLVHGDGAPLVAIQLAVDAAGRAEEPGMLARQRWLADASRVG